MPTLKPIPLLKFAFLVVILLFVVKLGSKFLSSKFPNVVTNAVDTVVQAA